MIASTRNEIAKSTRLDAIAAAGTRMRGKYTLVMRWLLPTRLFAASTTALLRKVHGIMPTNTWSAYGPDTFFDRPPKRPDSTEKKNVVASGWMIAHSAPSTVCL